MLDNTTTITIQVGSSSGEVIDISPADLQVSTLGISALSVTTSTLASAALASLDSAIDDVVDQRGAFGASQNRLQSAMRSIATATENLSGAESRIRDVDVAAETAELTKNRILQQAATSVLAQANTQPQLAMSLLQG